MRFPIKLNRSYWPKLLTQILPSVLDLRSLCSPKTDGVTFTSIVSELKFGKTFKTTQKKRFPLTAQELAGLEFQTQPVILDVGASDGSTSIDVMKAVPFEKYYLTDLNIEVFYNISGGTTYFYNERGDNIMMVTDKWVVYFDADGVIFPFDKILQLINKHIPKSMHDKERIFLIHPELQALNDGRVTILKHNMFETWPHEKVDLVIAANVLNLSYFSTSEILNALKNLVSSLKENGRIVIIDNRPHEQATIFQYTKGIIKLEKKINDGTDIEDLVLNFDGWE